jgi:hypothetical protein
VNFSYIVIDDFSSNAELYHASLVDTDSGVVGYRSPPPQHDVVTPTGLSYTDCLGRSVPISLELGQSVPVWSGLPPPLTRPVRTMEVFISP